MAAALGDWGGAEAARARAARAARAAEVAALSSSWRCLHAAPAPVAAAPVRLLAASDTPSYTIRCCEFLT